VIPVINHLNQKKIKYLEDVSLLPKMKKRKMTMKNPSALKIPKMKKMRTKTSMILMIVLSKTMSQK
jgi:hypothetical protein